MPNRDVVVVIEADDEDQIFKVEGGYDYYPPEPDVGYDAGGYHTWVTSVKNPKTGAKLTLSKELMEKVEAAYQYEVEELESSICEMIVDSDHEY